MMFTGDAVGPNGQDFGPRKVSTLQGRHYCRSRVDFLITRTKIRDGVTLESSVGPRPRVPVGSLQKLLSPMSAFLRAVAFVFSF